MQFIGPLTISLASYPGTTATLSYSFTQDPNPVVFVVTWTSTANTPTAVTFDGNAMTAVITQNSGSSQTYKLWKYFPGSNKASGTYNVVVTLPTTGVSLDSWIAEYSGIKDDFTSYNGGSTPFTSSPITISRTTVASNSWLMFFGRFTAFARTANGSSDGVLRSPTSYARAWVDSGASEGAAGSKSINVTSGSSPSGNFEYFVVELKRETSFTLNFSEATTALEVPVKQETRSIHDSVNTNDSQRKTISRSLQEIFLFVESIFTQASRRFTDSFAFSDTLRRAFSRTKLEVEAFSERISRSFTRTIRDSASFSDTPRVTGIWIPRTKPTGSWSPESAPASSWTPRTPTSAVFTPESSPSTSWTNRTKPTTTWS